MTLILKVEVRKEWLWEIWKIYKRTTRTFSRVPFEGFSSPLENARGELTDESKGSILVIVVPQVLRKSGLWEREGKIHEYLRGSTQFSLPLLLLKSHLAERAVKILGETRWMLSCFLFKLIDHFNFWNSKLIIPMSVSFAEVLSHKSTTKRAQLLHELK